MQEFEGLARRTGAGTQYLLLYRDSVACANRSSPSLHAQLLQGRRDPVGSTTCLRIGKPAAQPVSIDSLKFSLRHCRGMQNDLTRYIKPTCAIVIQFARSPASRPSLPHFPLDGRIIGIHTGAACKLTVQHERQHMAAVILLQRQVKRVSWSWLRRENGNAPAEQSCLSQVMPCPRSVVIAASVARECVDHCWRADCQIFLGGKDDRRARLCAHGGDLGVSRNGNFDWLRCREVKSNRRGCSSWFLQLHPNQLQEFDVILIRHQVDTVQQHIRHPGKKFDQCHTWITDVVVGPLPAIVWDEALRLVHDILKMAVVKRGCL